MYLAHNPQNLRITKNVNKSSCSSSNKLVCFRQGDRGRNEETNGTFRISHGCFHFLPVTLSSLLAPQSQVIKAPILDSPPTTKWSTTMTFHSNQSTPFVYQSSSSSPNRPPPLISMSSSSSSSSSLTSSAGAAASAAAGAAATAKAEGSARKALKGSAFSKE